MRYHNILASNFCKLHREWDEVNDHEEGLRMKGVILNRDEHSLTETVSQSTRGGSVWVRAGL